MSSATLEVVYQGPAAREGTLDAAVLAESLAGYSEVFRRANAIVNGPASEAAVRVRSEFRHGSFIVDLQFIQTVLEHGQTLITAYRFVDAAGLAALIGIGWMKRDKIKEIAESLLDLFKLFKGKKPEKVTPVGNNNVELTLGQKKTVVNVHIERMYGDSAIRQALAHATAPLRRADLDRVLMRQDGQEQARVEKDEADFFAEEASVLEHPETPLQGERTASLIISKLSFTEGTAWTFFERGATVVAKIEDPKFWQQVHNHEITFGEGDILNVRLAWKVEQKGKLSQKNTIIEVLGMRTRPKQLDITPRRRKRG